MHQQRYIAPCLSSVSYALHALQLGVLGVNVPSLEEKNESLVPH